MICDFKSKTSAAAVTLLCFLFVKRIRADTDSDTRLENFTLYLNVSFGSIEKLSSLSREKSPLYDSSCTQ